MPLPFSARIFLGLSCPVSHFLFFVSRVSCPVPGFSCLVSRISVCRVPSLVFSFQSPALTSGSRADAWGSVAGWIGIPKLYGGEVTGWQGSAVDRDVMLGYDDGEGTPRVPPSLFVHSPFRDCQSPRVVPSSVEESTGAGAGAKSVSTHSSIRRARTLFILYVGSLLVSVSRSRSPSRSPPNLLCRVH